MYARPLPSPYRIMIVDDHKFVAEMLAQRLSQDSSLKLVGIANVGSSALHIVEQQAVDIALLDMELEHEDGIGVAKQLLERNPQLRIIGLSMHDADYHPVALLEIGGMGYISKRANTKEICDAVRRVATGDMAISPQVAVHLAVSTQGAGPLDQVKVLTAKEVEVLSEIAHGFSVKQIAARAGLTEKTIQTHRNNMRKKLHATTDVQLCLIAIKAGLVDIHQPTV
ncbi:MAG: response regulator transcription factor [Gammaproteobacteria bacterium]|nr:response regulator transcription factor [Gammaproteobacteria bacterium]